MSADETRRSLLEQALQALDTMQSRLEASERLRRAPVAIIGMSCRFPGSPDIAGYWDLLRQGRDGVRDVPRDRWDADAYYDPDPQAPGKTSARRGGFLDRVDQFDPALFGISPREATAIDPQQRLVLEVAWEALETAGYAPDRLSGSATGVFVGITASDYGQMLRHATTPSDIYMATGNALNAAAGRVAFTLGLQGPCMAVDTACSSSLVATHLACQSLRNGESNLALAAGVNVILLPDMFVLYTKWGMMAPDGRCKTFDAGADGFVRGEGCGVVVLKRLADAIADGDNILAVIRGSAVNQDGRSSGLTVPNGLAQQSLLRRALDAADVRPGEVDYIEAHGTGTSLGDPIEAEALGEVFGEGRPADRPLLIGSVKSNVGHLESASGVAGLIKLVLALKHGAIPASLHFSKPSPRIPWDRLPLEVPTRLTPWPARSRARIGGVSSFGFSGTNAHLVLEQAPESTRTVAAIDRPAHVLTLSAKTDDALRALAARYADGIDREASLPDVCFTANTGRARFACRAAIVAESSTQLDDSLKGIAAGNSGPGIHLNQVQPGPRAKVAFLFTGQGSQYPAMGRELYERQPAFRKTIDRCNEILSPLLDRPLLSVLYGADEAMIDDTRYTQPALFALEYALAELWRSWGVEPDAVLGHSVGEYAAACVAGVFSLEDGLKLIAARAGLMSALPRHGAMVSLLADISAVSAILSAQQTVSVAAHNSPTAVVVSGPEEEVLAAVRAAESRGIKTTRLTVSHAFHSSLMEPMLDEFERIASEVKFSEPSIPIVTNVTGEMAGPRVVSSPAYWRAQVRGTVQFQKGMNTLDAYGCRAFIEIGPHPTLVTLGSQAVKNELQSCWLPSMRKGASDFRHLLDSMAELFVRGIEIDWAAFDADYPRRRVVLPTYPFQRQRYWAEAASVVGSAAGTDHDQSAGLVYEVAWQALDILPGPVPAASSDEAVVILGGGERFADAVAARIRRDGIRAVIVRAGSAYRRLTSDQYEIQAGVRDDMQRLWLDVTAGAHRVVAVVHAWNLSSSHETTPIEALKRGQLGASTLVQLSQAISATAPCPAPRVWIVTRAAQPVTGAERISIAQAPVWGLARTLALEHPERWGGVIDLDVPVDASADAGAVWDQIRTADGEDQVAMRGGARYVARLTRQTAARTRDLKVSADASYLITGGSGSIGLRTARWLVERGARHLWLVARRPPRPEQLGAIRDLEALGATVSVRAVDAGDLTQMSSLFDEIRVTAPPLRGVLHAAGVLSLHSVDELDEGTLQEVARPKIDAACVLDELTRDAALDFFVMFSSAAAIWGSKGLAHYGAANQFLDALAHDRRARGLPALSVNWGPWGGGGMASPEGERALAEIGVKALESGEALRALEYVAGLDVAQATIANVDWRVFSEVYEARARRPILDRVRGDVPHAPTTARPAAIKARLDAALPHERMTVLTRAVAQEVAAVLGLADQRPLDAGQGFFDLGMDSVMAVELRRRLESATGGTLPPTMAFDYPTVGLLTDFIAGAVLNLAPQTVHETPKAARSTDALFDSIEQMSDEEVERLFADKG